jgi:hypothetical protein
MNFLDSEMSSKMSESDLWPHIDSIANKDFYTNRQVTSVLFLTNASIIERYLTGTISTSDVILTCLQNYKD